MMLDELQPLLESENEVRYYSDLAQRDPERHSLALAHAFVRMSERLAAVGRHTLARDARLRAVRLLPQVLGILLRNAASYPDAVLLEAADYTSEFSERVASDGAQHEAAALLAQTVNIYQHLAKRDPAAYDSRLSNAYLRLARHFVDVGRLQDANLLTQAAAGLTQRAARPNPASDPLAAVDPLAVRADAVRIVARRSGESQWPLLEAALVFDHVRANVHYVRDPRGVDYFASPSETLSCGGGDCDDHAILVASLCEAVGMETRLVSCRNGTTAHMLCQVNLGSGFDVPGITRQLDTFYVQRDVPRARTYSWQHDDRGNWWIFADTTMGAYLGDTRGLADHAYLTTAPGGWKPLGTWITYGPRR